MKDPKIQEEVRIPEDLEFELDGNIVKVSGPKGEVSRELDMNGVSLSEKGGKIVIEADSDKRKHRALLGTAKSRLRNMIKGVTEGFVYRLVVLYSHFPISVKVEGDRVEIHNFLGESKPRVAKIVGGTGVKVEGDEIVVRGIDKEEAGQTAANIEQVAQVRERDPRVFQDGIYIIEEA